jgi:hypothetical protein
LIKPAREKSRGGFFYAQKSRKKRRYGVRDYLSIGSSPCCEDCAQVGSDDYFDKSRIELRAFKNQLIRVFGEPPFGSELRMKAFPHDFGTYHEVVCYFNDNEPESVEYAFNVEGNAPEKWDVEALREIAAGLQQLNQRRAETTTDKKVA